MKNIRPEGTGESLELAKQASDPVNAPTDFYKLYAKADGHYQRGPTGPGERLATAIYPGSAITAPLWVTNDGRLWVDPTGTPIWYLAV